MSNGKELQRTDAATGNDRRPAVDTDGMADLAVTRSSLLNTVEDTEDSKPKDGRRWSINRNPT